MQCRRTWCLSQRVLWLDEKFNPRGTDEVLLATCNLSYLTKKLSGNRKFDLATFFYFSAPPTAYEADEWSIVRKFTASRCLPPTLDILVPRYLVVFVDVVGFRKGTYRIPPSWNCLERATLTSLDASGPTRDCSYIIANVRENKYNAVVFVSTIIPVLNITTIDVTESTATRSKEQTHNNFLKFVQVLETVQNSVTCETLGFVETDCKRHIVPSTVLQENLPTVWERVSISSFGFTTFFVTHAPKPSNIILNFVHQYCTREWSDQWGRAYLHKKLVAVLLQMSFSSLIPRDHPSMTNPIKVTLCVIL